VFLPLHVPRKTLLSTAVRIELLECTLAHIPYSRNFASRL